MALTNNQLLDLGFKPSVRGRGGIGKTKKYDSLVLPLNDTDFLYTGYNPYKNQINYKAIWKSFKDSDGNRITYQVISLADTGYFELKNYINNTLATQAELSKELLHSSAATVNYDSPMAVCEGSVRSIGVKDNYALGEMNEINGSKVDTTIPPTEEISNG